jgi:hypothetical protein
MSAKGGLSRENQKKVKIGKERVLGVNRSKM